MTLYVCGLLYNETDPAAMQAIPDDGGYHVIRFGYADAASEEQTDGWGMHAPDNHPDGHVVTDWRTDPYSGMVYPAVDGYGELYAMIQWKGADFRSRDRFCRDPFGAPDTTNTEDRTHRFNSKAHKVYVRPGTGLSVQVRNMSGSTQGITHAQFKLYITPEAEVARRLT